MPHAIGMNVNTSAFNTNLSNAKVCIESGCINIHISPY